MVTSTYPPATLPISTSTTLSVATCEDGIKNQGEEYADCGGPCNTCELMELSGVWNEYFDSDYSFRFKERKGSGDNTQYWIGFKIPDGTEDETYLTRGESYIDHLRLKVVNYGEDKPTVAVKLNTKDLYSIPSTASLMTIGGRGCSQGGTDLCERNYNGYTIRLLNRLEGGARISIVGPTWEMPYKTEVKQGVKSYAPDHLLVIGGFFDRSHFINGGYNLFYVYMV